MKVQDLVLEMTERACRDIVRAARATPEDKLNWTPDGARSTLDILQEVTQSVMWPMMLGLAEKVPDFNPEMMAAMVAERKKLDTIDKCEEALNANLAQLRGFIASFPDERLGERLDLPFMPGMVLTRAEILFSHYWNTSYHMGQINYIQTMLGDKDMH